MIEFLKISWPLFGVEAPWFSVITSLEVVITGLIKVRIQGDYE